MEAIVEKLLKQDLKTHERAIDALNKQYEDPFSILNDDDFKLFEKKKNLMTFLNNVSLFKKEEGSYDITFTPLIPFSIFHNGFPVRTFVVDGFDNSVNIFYVSGGIFTDTRVLKEYDYSKKLEISTRIGIEL